MSETRLQLETRQEQERKALALYAPRDCDMHYAAGKRHGLELAELEARENAEVGK